ncbi:hypothetical protein ACVXHA_04495 [Escherichia coli]
MYAAANRHLRGEKEHLTEKATKSACGFSRYGRYCCRRSCDLYRWSYFITHHKEEESETLQSQKVTGNGLPPKPEERWRYIKELESRQPGVRAPTEPSAGGEVKRRSN